MNEEQNKNPQVREIDLVELCLKVWKRRRLVIKNCIIAGIAGVIIAFSIPKEYTTEVTLAPEESGSGGGLGGSLGSLASLAGINLGGMMSEDAISPDLYPDILSTTPFLVGLFNVPVQTKEGDLSTTLYDYLDEHQRKAWFSYVLSAPFDALGWFMGLFKEKEPEGDPATANYFNLTMDQAKMVKSLSKLITGEADKKTGLITLSVRMQDPLISAALADTVQDRLQDFITDYRTSKARKDLEFSEKLYAESRADYVAAQRAYADYVDKNLDVILKRYQVEEERLEKEVDLTYTVFNQVAQQVQLAKAKVQQQTPVYMVMQPAVMSVRASSPKKVLILFGFVFLAFFGTAAWVIFKDKLQEWRTSKE